jgi:hypothetical protein
MNTSRYAQGYIERGMAVVPIPHKRKSPVLPKWQNLRIEVEDIPRYFNGRSQNIGISLGEPSSGLVDVDLDVPEAVKLAGHFLPPTLTSGRVSAPTSHRWYRAIGAKTEKWKDTDGEMLVELRSTGCQTIVEPSIHPNGERYGWHRGGETLIEELSPEALLRSCRELATATLFARHLPRVGGRHDYALAVTGYLLRPGRLDEERVARIMLAAWQAAGADSREAVRDLEGIVRDTARNIKGGRGVVGGPTLAETAPGVPEVLARWWGWKRATSPEPSSLSAGSPSPAFALRPKLDEAAYHGLPGEMVKVMEPHTEADTVALFGNVLCTFGNAIGRGAYFRVGAGWHHLKVNVALVGETAKGRKGTSWEQPRELMHAVDSYWTDERVMNGLSSGEGLIFAIRDRVTREDSDGGKEVLDEGAEDKRLLVLEPELASTLKVMRREGNTLSAVIRQAYDDGRLQVMTRNNPMKATDAHVSIIGHITKAELLRYLTETEAANGFANRFLWLLVERSKLLPFGGEWHKAAKTGLVDRLRQAVTFGKGAGEITWGQSAREVWSEVYGPLSAGKPGLFGAVVGRAEAQVVRLASTYAVMHLSTTIEEKHLMAALAIWDYAEDSARYIFGDATDDAVADRIMQALRANPGGLTRTQIRDLFGRNQGANRIDQALTLLRQAGRVRKSEEETGGRPSERWIAT